MGNTKQLCDKVDCQTCFDKSFASHEKSKFWSSKNGDVKPRQVFKGSSNKYWFDPLNYKDCLQMKRIIRLLVLLLVVSALAGITSSCSVFNESSHANKPKSFQHKEPLPKKYIVNNSPKPIAK